MNAPDAPASSDPPDAATAALIDGLAAADAARVAAALALARRAYAGQVLGTGESALDHALGMAALVAGLKLDADARAAALLYALPAYDEKAAAALAADFGAPVAMLVEGISRLNRMRVLTRGIAGQEPAAGKSAPAGGQASQTEVLRKMILAMVEDLRVVLLRLASRTQTLRQLAAAPEALRRQVARETLDLYAPLANRLGVWQLKWELEDLSFRFLEPELYKRLARELDGKRVEREAFVEAARARLARELAAAGVEAEVSGRPKHLYSIWNKMRNKGLALAELRDLRGLRVLVEDVKDCYVALGVVHDLWQPIPREFDDYISRPKANDYRSLHTAVTAEDGRALEVQIRTREMHRQAELGVAAHWRYKEGSSAPKTQQRGGAGFDDKIAFLRRMLAWRDEVVDGADWVERTKRAALDDTVYVLTPQGRVIDLPRDSTPVDFAYALHTDLGHRCRGAKVDGQIVPLDYRLKNGDRVEISAAKTGGPSRDWLNAELGYLASSRARHKVRQWFNSLALEQTIAEGRAVVEREMAREGRSGANLEALATSMGFARAEDLFAAVGRGETGTRALQLALRGESPSQEPEPELRPSRSRAPGRADPSGGVLVVGVDRLLTQLARCCKPAPPDAIAGFVTRGRGISIHRRDCASLARLAERYPERRIETTWGTVSGGTAVYPVDVVVRAADRQGLLRDLSDALARERLNVLGAHTLSRDGTATLTFTVEVASIDALKRALPQVAAVPGVYSVQRR